VADSRTTAVCNMLYYLIADVLAGILYHPDIKGRRLVSGFPEWKKK
jgi:hypothetical protein